MDKSSFEQSAEAPFWQKPLNQLNEAEWESLCDGCGRCCLRTLKDDATGRISHTRVVCRVYDERRCQCGSYPSRQSLVPECLNIREHDISSLNWLPTSCAYRLRSEDKQLFDWHPLIAGSTAAMDAAGISIRGRVLSEEFVHDDGLEEHIINWVSSSEL